MLPGYEKKSNWGALGLLLILGGAALASMCGVVGGVLGLAMLCGGAVLWFYGLGCYAIGKGYSGLLAFLGLFGILGLLLLLALHDKHAQSPVEAQER